MHAALQNPHDVSKNDAQMIDRYAIARPDNDIYLNHWLVLFVRSMVFEAVMNHISATAGKEGDSLSPILKVLGLNDEQTRVVGVFEMSSMWERHYLESIYSYSIMQNYLVNCRPIGQTHD